MAKTKRKTRQAHEDSSQRRDILRSRLPLLLLLAGAFLLRLPNLGESLWFDEVWYTSIFLKGQSFSSIVLYDVHPPLYTFIMRGWIELFGDSEISVRLTSLILGLLSIGLIFALTRNWFGRTAAILSAALVALSAVHIWYSQEVKNNILLLLLSLLTIYALTRAWNDNRRGSWILFIAAAIASLSTNRFALWIVAAAFAWLWLQTFRKEGRPRLRWALVCTGAVALGYLPLFLKMLSQMGNITREYLRAFTPGDVYTLLLVYLSHGNTLRTISPYRPWSQLLEQPWTYFLIDGFFALLVGSGLFVLLQRLRLHSGRSSLESRRTREISELLLLWFLLPLLSLLTASLIYPAIYVERSMIILLPPFFILMAVAVMSMKRRWARGVLAASLLSLSLLSLFNLWVVKADEWTVYKPNPDWRSAAEYLVADTTKSKDPFFVVQSIPTEALSYYYNRLSGSGSHSGRRGQKELPAGTMRVYEEAKFMRFLSEYRIRTIYLIRNRYWLDNFEKVYEQIHNSRFYEYSGEKEFKGLVIYKYRVHREGFRHRL